MSDGYVLFANVTNGVKLIYTKQIYTKNIYEYISNYTRHFDSVMKIIKIEIVRSVHLQESKTEIETSLGRK